MKTALANNLRKIMFDREISGLALANLSGVPQPRVSAILSGQTQDPRIGTVLKIAGALGVTVEELTGDKAA